MGTGTLEPRMPHWGLALLSALVLHGACLGWLAMTADRPGAMAAGVGGIQVSLGPSGGAPGESSEVVPEDVPGAEEAPPEATEAVPPDAVAQAVDLPPEVQSVTTPQQEIETVEAVPEVSAQAASEVVPAAVPLYAPVEPVTAREALPEIAVAEVSEVEPEEVVAEAPTPVSEPTVLEVKAEEVETARKAMETPAPPPAKPAPPVEEVVETKPQSEPEPVATAKAEEREVTDQKTAAAAVSSSIAAAKGNPDAAVQGNEGKAGIGDSKLSGSATAKSAGGNPGDYVDYGAILNDWLTRHKKYPRRAKLRGYEGTAWLTFAIDSEGRLLDYKIDESTGYKMLDNEVAAMIERAAPLPAPPPGGQKNRFIFRVPVGFDLH